MFKKKIKVSLFIKRQNPEEETIRIYRAKAKKRN